MGQALYRKHRSKSLDEVIGQDHITGTLKKALKKSQISHAYLFTGPRGVGKTSVARILAHEINGIDYTGEKTHLDIIEIDAASNRRIDEIRELRDKVHIAPTSSKYKVYIIDEVHMLTREAFNALLKTLEEPPEHAVFILATTEAHKVPDTIISRTQRYSFKPIEHSKAVEHLRNIAKTEGLKIDDGALQLLSEHGKGSFRDSISMLDQLSGLGKTSYTEADVRLLLGLPESSDVAMILDLTVTGNAKELLAHISHLKGEGYDAALTIKALSRRLRDQFAHGDMKLDKTSALRLLTKLNATGSNVDFMDLEIALLDVVAADATLESAQSSNAAADAPPKPVRSKSVNEHVTEKSVKKPEVFPTPNQSSKNKSPQEMSPQKDATEDKKEADTEAVSLVTGDEFGEKWKLMLDDIKTKHNTLHGVLRMASADFAGDEIVLSFSFEFHKKQLQSPKNSPLMNSFVKKHLGDIKLSAVVNKSANNSVESPEDNRPKKPETADVDNVSSIFGGAELLE